MFLTLRPGDAAPVFRATTIDGREIALSELRGKVVLIDFWATWCAPCVAEIPTIKRALNKYGTNGEFVVVGVSLDSGADVVRRFVEQRKIPWPQIALGPAEQNEIAKKYNVVGIPATFLIDRDGKVAAVELRGAALDQELGKLLQKTEE
jgi:peroxiredoxin